MPSMTQSGYVFPQTPASAVSNKVCLLTCMFVVALTAGSNAFANATVNTNNQTYFNPEIYPDIHDAIGLNINAINEVNAKDTVASYQLDWHMAVSSHSPTQPIASFVDDWDAPLDTGTYAFVQGRTGADYRTRDRSIGYGVALRYDYVLAFTEETARLYWQYKNEQPLDASAQYPLSITANHSQRIGANVFATLQPQQWLRLTPRVNLWHGMHMIDGEFAGSLHSLPQTSPTERLQAGIDTAIAGIRYHYDRPALKEQQLDWSPTKPQGMGYSFDVQMQADLGEHTSLTVAAYDVLGKMHWQDAPVTQYNLDYDIGRRPSYTIDGKLDKQTHWQTLPWRAETTLTQKITPNWALAVGSEHNSVSDLYQLSAHYKTQLPASVPVLSRTPIEITGIIEPQTQAIGLALDTQHFGIKWMADALDTQDAKRGDVRLYARYAW